MLKMTEDKRVESSEESEDDVVVFAASSLVVDGQSATTGSLERRSPAAVGSDAATATQRVTDASIIADSTQTTALLSSQIPAGVTQQTVGVPPVTASQMAALQSAVPLTTTQLDTSSGPATDQLLVELMKMDSGALHDFELPDEKEYFGGLEASERRWRQKHTDASDWFNFGFGEETWRDYCVAQQKWRYLVQKKQIDKRRALLSFQRQRMRPVALANTAATGGIPLGTAAIPRMGALPQSAASGLHGTSNPLMSVGMGMAAGIAPGTALTTASGARISSLSTGNAQLRFGVCFEYQKNGFCSRAAMCRYSHDLNPVSIDRQMGVCFEFQNKGTCNWGANCRWKHIVKGAMAAMPTTSMASMGSMMPQTAVKTSSGLLTGLPATSSAVATVLPSVAAQYRTQTMPTVTQFPQPKVTTTQLPTATMRQAMAVERDGRSRHRRSRSHSRSRSRSRGRR